MHLSWALASLWMIMAVCEMGTAARAAEPTVPLPPLHVSENGRFLVTPDGQPVFLMTDTAWYLSMRLSREDVTEYLRARKAQHFNAVAFIAYGLVDADGYGSPPLDIVNGRPDPTRPIVTAGDNPDHTGEYDYWDQVDYCIRQAATEGLYAVVLPVWGNRISGDWSGGVTDEIVFHPDNAYPYGRFIGERFKHHANVLWMLGGDRSAVYGDLDYRPVYRAMARGLVDGLTGGPSPWSRGTPPLLSYHPRKTDLQSSAWFHNDDWLSLNSIQHWPEDQVPAVENDVALAPPKPTWVFEPRYEAYERDPYQASDWGDWQMRYQAYQTVFAGAFGHTYGHTHIYPFAHNWREHLHAPGAQQMQHLVRLMTMWNARQYLERVPDQTLIDGDAGAAERLRSNRITATRGESGDYAMFYSANGRTIPVRMAKLAGPAMEAYWFNPRNGKWRMNGIELDARRPFLRVTSGPDAPVQQFVPPDGERDGNDWVLVLATGATP